MSASRRVRNDPFCNFHALKTSQNQAMQTVLLQHCFQIFHPPIFYQSLPQFVIPKASEPSPAPKSCRCNHRERSHSLPPASESSCNPAHPNILCTHHDAVSLGRDWSPQRGPLASRTHPLLGMVALVHLASVSARHHPGIVLPAQDRSHHQCGRCLHRRTPALPGRRRFVTDLLRSG